MTRAQPRLPDRLGRLLGFRPQLTVEALCIIAGVFFALTASSAFWREVVATGDLHGVSGAWMGAMLFVAIAAVNTLLMSMLLYGRMARPALTVLLLVTAVAAHFTAKYMVYLDDDMLRNILHTDVKESRELITLGFVPDLLLFGVLPVIVLWRARVQPRRTWMRAVLARVACAAGALLVGVVAIAASFQGIAGFMHGHRDARHLLAPGNYLVSLARVITHDNKPAASRPRTPVGADARVSGKPAGAKPRLLVLVVGETVRAQNWGLNGYVRQTTPQLKAIDPINFIDVTACGSATEISLPCMFAPVGRRDYDKERIKHSQSLLHALEHAGITTLWRDNQTGCKGVCEGLAFDDFEHGTVPGVCTSEGCHDDVLLSGLQEKLDKQPGDMVVVLHQLGNHGPAYFKRYPPTLRRFLPDCQTSELGECTSQQVVNSYDNAILATDAFVAKTIGFLAAQEGKRDTAMIFVSDHGESLGENGLFLHGVPYAIAPETQTKVPMVMWLSPGMKAARGIDESCLRGEARKPATHDNLFHSVLGLLQVSTRDYAPALDLFARCERPVTAAVPTPTPGPLTR
ncbi:phosphoethanolamine transferase [Lysobacter fragariae]